MKIAIAGDAFEVFTSGFPVRGMFWELVNMRKSDTFVVYYSRKCNNKLLQRFYDAIEASPNVEIRFFKDNHKLVVLKRMLGLSYVRFDDDIDCFINPGAVEYINNYDGPQISVLTDLSTIHNYSTHRYALFFKYWNRYAYKKVISRLYLLNVISDYTKKDVMQTFPCLKDCPIKVIYNGIDDFWFDNQYASCDFLDTLGCQKYFIWWGCVSRRKNIGNLVQAYKLQKKKSPDLPKLLLIGSWLSYMDSLKESLINDEDIMIIPFQKNYVLKTLVKNSSGLIFPSFYEGYGLPVIEAFSQGVPVACSNVTSLPEIANGHALLFDPYDIESIADSIRALYMSDNFDSADLKLYASQFTYYKMAQEYSSILDNIAKN